MKNERIIIIGFVLMVIALTTILIIQGFFYEKAIESENKICNDMWGNMMVENNRLWVDVWEGKKNLTVEEVYFIKSELNRIENKIKNG